MEFDRVRTQTEEQPFIVEPSDELLVGYRSWNVGMTDTGEPYLLPLVYRQRWPWMPGENTATGAKYPATRFVNSNLGFYSVKDPNLPTHIPTSTGEVGRSWVDIGDVGGAILPFGLVVEGDRGYRSSKARIKELLLRREPFYIAPCRRFWSGDKNLHLYTTFRTDQNLVGNRISSEVVLERLSNKYNVPIARRLE